MEDGPDSEEKFETGNYGVSTTSKIEWFFVVDPTEDSLRKLDCDKWPKEADKLLDIARHRQPQAPRT